MKELKQARASRELDIEEVAAADDDNMEGAIEVYGPVDRCQETVRNVGYVQRARCLLVVSSNATEENS